MRTDDWCSWWWTRLIPTSDILFKHRRHKQIEANRNWYEIQIARWWHLWCFGCNILMMYTIQCRPDTERMMMMTINLGRWGDGASTSKLIVNFCMMLMIRTQTQSSGREKNGRTLVAPMSPYSSLVNSEEWSLPLIFIIDCPHDAIPLPFARHRCQGETGLVCKVHSPRKGLLQSSWDTQSIGLPSR